MIINMAENANASAKKPVSNCLPASSR